MRASILPSLGRHRALRPHSARAGGALVSSLLVAATLAAIASAAFQISMRQNSEARAQGERLRALFLAEAGLSETLRALAVEIDAGTPAPLDLAFGAELAPLDYLGGEWWSTVADNGDGSYTLRASGRIEDATRTVEATAVEIDGGVFDHAIFAGNRSNDPAYELRLSGVGVQGDEVVGDVFSGGDVEVVEDASVTGDVYATGTVSGWAGRGGESRPLPDIAGMNYAANHDVDVAAAFASATSQSSPLGGTALELPESSPAHIFRKNPSDRLSEISGTPKDDYFLEDPHMPTGDYVAFNGTSGHTITLSGTMGAPGPSGTDLVYYIDGNLWVHNPIFYTLRLQNTDPEGVKVTFVVRGNVYFSDDVDLADPTNDGVAFIAIEDPTEPDSGNIYLGDPRFGTLERMRAFLYAENDFFDTNLSATGSSTVELFGNMTAGNHVAIQRDFTTSSGVVHSKLTVNFDDRLSTGVLELPGLPGPIGGGVGGLEIVFWREAPTP